MWSRDIDSYPLPGLSDVHVLQLSLVTRLRPLVLCALVAVLFRDADGRSPVWPIESSLKIALGSAGAEVASIESLMHL